jgi:hypothetical protein
MSYSRKLDISTRQSAIALTLSVPMQAGLFLSLCSLTLWTLYFSSYPPVHNAMHHMRHGTAAIACH